MTRPLENQPSMACGYSVEDAVKQGDYKWGAERKPDCFASLLSLVCPSCPLCPNGPCEVPSPSKAAGACTQRAWCSLEVLQEDSSAHRSARQCSLSNPGCPGPEPPPLPSQPPRLIPLTSSLSRPIAPTSALQSLLTMSSICPAHSLSTPIPATL